MIAHLKGLLLEKAADRLVVEVNDIGYEVLIPFSTYYELGEVGDTVSLRIYTHVREDVLCLYGFLTRKEKKLFTQLIQVSGIGPKLGVTILSGLPVDEFTQALVTNDLVGLTTGYVPRFVKPQADLKESIEKAVSRYCDEVRQGTFPGPDQSYNE